MASVVGMRRHPNQNKGRGPGSNIDDSVLIAAFHAMVAEGHRRRYATTVALDACGYLGDKAPLRSAALSRLQRKLRNERDR